MILGTNERGGGYLSVVQPRDGEYHAKVSVDGGQHMLPGPACKTPQEAALRLAKYEAAPFPIIKKDPDRAAKGDGRVAAARCSKPARLWLLLMPRAFLARA